MKATLRSTMWLAISVLLTACATPPPAQVNYPPPAPAAPPVAASPPALALAPPPPAPVAPPAPVVDTSANDRALLTAVATYDRGDYAQAARLLTPLVNDGKLDSEQQLRALKTLAFSQCSTNATTACQQTFERAFRIDRHFDLAPAERGHPIWGPRFERARKLVTGK